MGILIADDDQDIQRLLGRILKSWGHEVTTANNGQEALDILKKAHISFVISDWMMPKMDGLELCRHIRSSDFGRYIYIILLTARDAKNDLIHGMESGADDFVVKPFNRGELKVRIRAGERMVALKRDPVDANDPIQHAYDRFNRDLEAGAQMQRSLLPPPDFTVPGEPNYEISSPVKVLEELNERFQVDDETMQYFTMVYGMINRRDGMLQRAPAGHPPAIHVPCNDKIVNWARPVSRLA